MLFSDMVFNNFAPETNINHMKTIFSKIGFIAIILSLLSSTAVMADGLVAKGSNVLGFGFGMANRYYGYSGFSPGVKINFESGLWQAGPGVVTLGGTLGYTFQRYRYGYVFGGYDYSWHNFIIAARSAWHHNWGVDKLDTYAGVSAGVRIMIFNDGDDPYNNPDYNTVYPHFGGFIGACYYFKPGLGVFGEVGYDINFFTVGLNLNFGGR
jgi:hypothetical protein